MGESGGGGVPDLPPGWGSGRAEVDPGPASRPAGRSVRGVRLGMVGTARRTAPGPRRAGSGPPTRAAAGPRAPPGTEAPQPRTTSHPSARPLRGDSRRPGPAPGRHAPPPAAPAAHPPPPAVPLLLSSPCDWARATLRTRACGPAPAEHAPPAAHPGRLRVLAAAGSGHARWSSAAGQLELASAEYGPDTGARTCEPSGRGCGNPPKARLGASGAERATSQSRRPAESRVDLGTHVRVVTTSSPERAEKGSKGSSGCDLSRGARRPRPGETAGRRQDRDTASQERGRTQAGTQRGQGHGRPSGRDRQSEVTGGTDPDRRLPSSLGEESQRPLRVSWQGAGEPVSPSPMGVHWRL